MQRANELATKRPWLLFEKQRLIAVEARDKSNAAKAKFLAHEEKIKPLKKQMEYSSPSFEFEFISNPHAFLTFQCL